MAQGISLNFPVEDFLDSFSSREGKLQDSATIKDVMEQFVKGSPAVVIVDEDDKPIGIFTPSDTRTIKKVFSDDPENPAQEFMSKPVIAVKTSDTIRHALKIMQERRIITGITVVDSKGKYAGYLYRPDLQRKLDSLQNFS